ncbi:MAG: ATP-binding cassette domain-containing protein [Alphaproteobacteria bacterium]|nr:ATP-binding cassette domain-containing protein [Alphaproteobacteria bacterium]
MQREHPTPASEPVDTLSATRPFLRVQGLKKYFRLRGGSFGLAGAYVQAVDGVSFVVATGETLGVVGESGCGKSTTARLLMRLIEPDEGQITLQDRNVGGHNGMSLRTLRRQVQLVFQDSYASLNPRHTMAEEVGFGLIAQGIKRAEARRRANEVLELVGLEPAIFADRYPHELSGGQRQRVNVARALALSPQLLLLDEAVSSLDKSVEAQVLNLLIEIKNRLNLTYVFISHDLNVVRFISDRVLVMYLGKVVETGPVEKVYTAPGHPYTRALIASRLSMDPSRRVEAAPVAGDLPSPINPPSGCRFRTRCPFAESVCSLREPPLEAFGDDPAHSAACHALIPGSGHSRAPAPGGEPSTRANGAPK